MLNIQVTDDYKLTSDGMQIIIQRRQIVDPTKSPIFDETKHSSEIREEWKTWKYCGKVEQAIDLILRQNIFESDAQTLSEVRNEITLFQQEIKRSLYGDEEILINS